MENNLEKNKLKILMVGDYHSTIHERPLAKSFRELGHEVEEFMWYKYFQLHSENIIERVFHRAQNKLTWGPILFQLNEDLISIAQSLKPDLIFVYRQTHLFPKTISRLKRHCNKIFGYNNDDPFSEKYKKYYWRHYMRSLKLYDHIYSYRHKNVDDYKNMGLVSVSILRSFYIKERMYKMSPSSVREKYKNDVVFIGHFENDGRDELVKDLFRMCDFKLYGPDWATSKSYLEICKLNGSDEITPLINDYNEAINGAKIALVFLSKLNNDTYTRRCFEIPATGTLMLAEYSWDLASNLYEADKEAVYFSNFDELKTKIAQLLSDQERLSHIAESGYKRIMSDGHEAIDRAKQIVSDYTRLEFK